jgi:DNA-binding LacI/PurR family transcriptional regulator/DNA-binding transcriptional regulator YhcF (GntR family)
MADKKTAVMIAEEYLRNQLKTNLWSAGDRLPSLKRLAVLAGVSPNTMGAAVHRLGSEGIFAIIPRGRVSVTSSAQSAHALTHLSKPWQKKRVEIEKDLLNGRFGTEGSLPASKQMQAQYGISYNTLRKILNSLLTSGVVASYKHTFRVLPARTPETLSTIAFFSEGKSIDDMILPHPRERKLIDLLETECSQSRMKILPIGLDLSSSSGVRAAIARLGNDRKIGGFFLNAWWPTIPGVQGRYHDLLDALIAMNKPVAILDQDGEFELPPRLHYRRGLSIFQIAGRLAGCAIGRRLLSLGHRNTAFFSYRHGQRWSQKRLLGINEEFCKAGLPDGICAHTRDDVSLATELVLAAGGFSEADFERMFKQDMNREQYEDFFARYRAVNARLTLPDAGFFAEARTELSVLSRMAKEYPGSKAFPGVRSAVFRDLEDRLLNAYLQPVFEKALEDKRITAWVGANDATSLAGLAYLKQRHIKPGNEISVVSFENSHEGFEARLTSYDFNLAGIVHRMFRFLTEPIGESAPVRIAPIEVEGMLIERET